jgi:hypothetical protein
VPVVVGEAGLHGGFRGFVDADADAHATPH